MTVWHIIVGTLILMPCVLNVREIWKQGFRNWLRESTGRSALQHLAGYFPKGFRVIGPAAYLLLVIFCLFKIALRK